MQILLNLLVMKIRTQLRATLRAFTVVDLDRFAVIVHQGVGQILLTLVFATAVTRANRDIVQQSAVEEIVHRLDCGIVC